MKTGQIMLITVLTLSGTILGATAIAGLLMLYQIRQSTDAVNSMKAVFAADSGMEFQIYDLLKNNICPGANSPTEKFLSDGKTKFSATCDFDAGSETITIRAQGQSGNTARAFRQVLTPRK